MKLMKIYIWRINNFYTKLHVHSAQMHIVHIIKRMDLTHTHFVLFLPATLKQANTLSYAHTHMYMKNPRLTYEPNDEAMKCYSSHSKSLRQAKCLFWKEGFVDSL